AASSGSDWSPPGSSSRPSSARTTPWPTSARSPTPWRGRMRPAARRSRPWRGSSPSAGRRAESRAHRSPMPEGRESRRTADRLAEDVAGRPLVSAWFGLPALRRHAKTLPGRRVVAVEARGKALLTRFDHGWTLYTHNQLYEVWKVCAAGERPQTTRVLRVALETADRA